MAKNREHGNKTNHNTAPEIRVFLIDGIDLYPRQPLSCFDFYCRLSYLCRRPFNELDCKAVRDRETIITRAN